MSGAFGWHLILHEAFKKGEADPHSPGSANWHGALRMACNLGGGWWLKGSLLFRSFLTCAIFTSIFNIFNYVAFHGFYL